MANLKDLAKSFREKAKTLEANAKTLTQGVALAIDRAVVYATPIDTGRAVSNWRVFLSNSFSNPHRDFLEEAYVPGLRRSTAMQNISAAILQGSVGIAAFKPGMTIHVYNNLPYIGDLNRGTSKQAPAGFVQTSLLAGSMYASSVTNLLTSKVRPYDG